MHFGVSWLPQCLNGNILMRGIVLQGGAKRTPWKLLSTTPKFIDPACWPGAVPQKDPSQLTKEENALLFKRFQESSSGQLKTSEMFQFQ